jgi:hypothetical protein
MRSCRRAQAAKWAKRTRARGRLLTICAAAVIAAACAGTAEAPETADAPETTETAAAPTTTTAPTTTHAVTPIPADRPLCQDIAVPGRDTWNVIEDVGGTSATPEAGCVNDAGEVVRIEIQQTCGDFPLLSVLDGYGYGIGQAMTPWTAGTPDCDEIRQVHDGEIYTGPEPWIVG